MLERVSVRIFDFVFCFDLFVEIVFVVGSCAMIVRELSALASRGNRLAEAYLESVRSQFNSIQFNSSRFSTIVSLRDIRIRIEGHHCIRCQCRLGSCTTLPLL